MKSIGIREANTIDFNSRVELRARKVNTVSFDSDGKVKGISCYNLSLSLRILYILASSLYEINTNLS